MTAALEISLVLLNQQENKKNVHQSVDEGNGGFHVCILQAFSLELLF